jgi:hypothetical protein
MGASYSPTAEIHDQSKWDKKELEPKGLLETDLFASARGVLKEIEDHMKANPCEISGVQLSILETLSSSGKSEK